MPCKRQHFGKTLARYLRTCLALFLQEQSCITGWRIRNVLTLKLWPVFSQIPSRIIYNCLRATATAKAIVPGAMHVFPNCRWNRQEGRRFCSNNRNRSWSHRRSADHFGLSGSLADMSHEKEKTVKRVSWSETLGLASPGWSCIFCCNQDR